VVSTSPGTMSSLARRVISHCFGRATTHQRRMGRWRWVQQTVPGADNRFESGLYEGRTQSTYR
jgi:hypothetical protein